tara:strand:- start:387 stop:839 length:453 start_codon:yes stop_codon:yes gene_type:complete
MAKQKLHKKIQRKIKNRIVNPKFQKFLNISVFVALLMVFIFAELNQHRNRNIFTGIITIIIFSSILLLLAIYTIFPNYVRWVGWTLIISSIIMTISGLFLFNVENLTVFSVAKIFTAIVLFLFGLKLKSKEKSFIPFDVYTDPKNITKKF